MSDLFYTQGLTVRDQIELLKKDLLSYSKTIGNKKRKFSILFGDDKNVNNCVLFIQPPFLGEHYFNEEQDKLLLKLINKYAIDNYFITYSGFFLSKYGKNDIKNFGSWIEKIIEIIMPRLIIVLGEEAELVFFRRKFILKDFFGKIIGEHNNIPIILIHPMEYFLQKSAYENEAYKSFLEGKDWASIKLKYDKVITKETFINKNEPLADTLAKKRVKTAEIIEKQANTLLSDMNYA